MLWFTVCRWYNVRFYKTTEQHRAKLAKQANLLISLKSVGGGAHWSPDVSVRPWTPLHGSGPTETWSGPDQQADVRTETSSHIKHLTETWEKSWQSNPKRSWELNPLQREAWRQKPGVSESLELEAEDGDGQSSERVFRNTPWCHERFVHLLWTTETTSVFQLVSQLGPSQHLVRWPPGPP